MITYNSTYVKKLSKDVSEVEKVFYEIPAAFTKDGKLYMHNNESSSYYTDGLNQPYTAKEFIRIQFLKTTELLSQSKHQILICNKKEADLGFFFYIAVSSSFSVSISSPLIWILLTEISYAVFVTVSVSLSFFW